jgi:hypothetical protein
MLIVLMVLSSLGGNDDIKWTQVCRYAGFDRQSNMRHGLQIRKKRIQLGAGSFANCQYG